MKIAIERKMNAPAEKLWSYIADFNNVYRFNPYLSGSHSINKEGSTCDIGASRQCDMKMGGYLQERVTEWEEGSHYTVEITKTSMPLKSGTATIGVKSIGTCESLVFLRFNIESTFKILNPIFFLAFKYMMAPGILKGMEDLYIKEQQLAPA